MNIRQAIVVVHALVLLVYLSCNSLCLEQNTLSLSLLHCNNFLYIAVHLFVPIGPEKIKQGRMGCTATSHKTAHQKIQDLTDGLATETSLKTPRQMLVGNYIKYKQFQGSGISVNPMGDLLDIQDPQCQAIQTIHGRQRLVDPFELKIIFDIYTRAATTRRGSKKWCCNVNRENKYKP